MRNAITETPTIPIGKLIGTGIIIKARDKNTGEFVKSGVQLNNTTMEIEALPNLIVYVDDDDNEFNE